MQPLLAFHQGIERLVGMPNGHGKAPRNASHSSVEFELLEAFVALSRECNVTHAAERLGRTQSAVSKQLRRLREVFDDDLFLQVGRQMSPTPRAEALLPGVLELLERWEALMSQAAFDPAQVARRYVISTTDEVQAELLGGLFERLRTVAPSARLMVVPLRDDYSLAQLESGSVQVVISVNWSAPDSLVQRHLYSDTFVCAMRAGHPLARGTLSLKKYVGAEHLLVAPLGQERGIADRLLAEQDLERRVALHVPRFLDCAQPLGSTDLIALLPRRVARRLAQLVPLKLKPSPLLLPPIDYYVFWHRRYDREPEHRLLRQLVVESAPNGKRA